MNGDYSRKLFLLSVFYLIYPLLYCRREKGLGGLFIDVFGQ